MKMQFIYRRVLLALMLCLILCTLTSARRCANKKPRLLKLTSIHIVDRNGLSETLSGKERLNLFQNVNFLQSQPYQKVLRIYERDSKGDVRSVVNTYHENGNPQDFLEILNGRACGRHIEWHENGKVNVMTNVIGGMPDVTCMAKRSYIYDRNNRAWDEDGCLIADFNYCQGSLEGFAMYYREDGSIWKKIPYEKNQIAGTAEIYTASGEIFQLINYSKGQRNGNCTRYWCPGVIASCEEFCEGKILSGQYFDKEGVLISEIVEGNGYRVAFGEEFIKELQQFENGILEGEVKRYNAAGRLKLVYHMKNGIKHGEEIEYYDQFPSTLPDRKKSTFNWYEGKMQGEKKSWYIDGTLECQKEMSNNFVHGVLTAWYRSGDLMMIEEYDRNKLERGDYFKKGEKFPISQVQQGKGIATRYDADGYYIQKISYLNGKPEL